MSRVPATLFVVLLTSLGVLEALALSGRGPAPTLSILSVYALFGVGSLGVQYVLQTHRPRARLFVLGIVAGGAAATAVLLAFDAVSLRTAARGGLALAGLAGLAGYASDAMAAAPGGRTAAWRALRDATVVPLAVMQVPFFLWATTGINPVFDARVLAFEASLGVNLSRLAHAAFAAVPGVDLVAMACYVALPIGLAVVVQQQPSAARRLRVLVAALASGAAGFALYAVSPVVGIFPAFPAGLPEASTVSAVPMIVAAEVPRNGMPSLHTAWALLIALNAWPLGRRGRWALTTFAALNVWTAAGAVGHWALDIVVAIPLAAAVQLACVSDRDTATRAMGAGVCLAIAIAWVVGLRTGVTPAGGSMLLAWLLVAGTVGVPWAWLAWSTATPTVSGRR